MGSQVMVYPTVAAENIAARHKTAKCRSLNQRPRHVAAAWLLQNAVAPLAMLA